MWLGKGYGIPLSVTFPVSNIDKKEKKIVKKMRYGGQLGLGDISLCLPYSFTTRNNWYFWKDIDAEKDIAVPKSGINVS